MVDNLESTPELRILYADDEPLACRVVEKILRKGASLNVIVEPASTVEVAIRKLKEFEYDLVITDDAFISNLAYRSGRGNGSKLVKYIREEKVLSKGGVKEIPVIVLSASPWEHIEIYYPSDIMFYQLPLLNHQEFLKWIDPILKDWQSQFLDQCKDALPMVEQLDLEVEAVTGALEKQDAELSVDSGTKKGLPAECNLDSFSVTTKLCKLQAFKLCEILGHRLGCPCESRLYGGGEVLMEKTDALWWE